MYRTAKKCSTIIMLHITSMELKTIHTNRNLMLDTKFTILLNAILDSVLQDRQLNPVQYDH